MLLGLSGTNALKSTLMRGTNARKHEMTLFVYLGLIGKDLFTQNFFNRAFVVMDNMADVRKTMGTLASDPNTIDIVRNRLARISKARVRVRADDVVGWS